MFEKWFAVEKEDGKVEREVMAADRGLGFTKVWYTDRDDAETVNCKLQLLTMHRRKSSVLVACLLISSIQSCLLESYAV